jgi:hypothetical protein
MLAADLIETPDGRTAVAVGGRLAEGDASVSVGRDGFAVVQAGSPVAAAAGVPRRLLDALLARGRAVLFEVVSDAEAWERTVPVAAEAAR